MGTLATADIRKCGAFDGVRFVSDDATNGAGVDNITTRVATCRRARKIGWGFTCRRMRLGAEYSDARCTASRGRVVRFQYGA